MKNVFNIFEGKNWHKLDEESRNFADKLADWVANFVGSWTFVIIHALWFGIWIIFSIEPFPYGLLTMIVSLEAIMLSTFIMMSQNRQADRDRVQAQADYDTNTSAKVEIEDLQAQLARIENEKLDEILKVLKNK